MIQVLQRPTPNFRAHSVPRDVRAAVIHIAEGRAAGVDSWFASRESQVSAHFLVGLNGTLRQYVSIHDVAWHAGRVLGATWRALPTGNPNDTTVGIEHEGNGLAEWPEPMLLTSTMLAAWLCTRFGWEPTELRFPMHREIFAAKTCPGPAFNRTAYLARVRAILATFTADEIRCMVEGIR